MMRVPATTLAILTLLAATAASAAPPTAGWVASWASAQQIPEPQNAAPDDGLRDATLRQVVRLTTGGRQVRVRLSNAFGTAPLRVLAAHVARSEAPGSPRIIASDDRALTFAGRAEVTLPAGADYVSDPVDLAAAPLASLTVSLRLAEPPARQTGHPGSRATSYLAPGDQVSAPELKGATAIEHWYELASVEVQGDSARAAIVVLGDSITDGHGATTDANDRWPDILADRLQASPRTRGVGVLNAGIGGNRLLLDGLGPNALARFDRDVLTPAGVRWLIVLEGVNDLGTLTRDGEASPQAHAALVSEIIGAYRQMIVRAHAHGIKAIGATILPYGGATYYHPTAQNEADRLAINRWIRAPGRFDAVIDFDAVTRDPEHPERMRPGYDSGDHLHPSPAGYRAMGEAVPLALFAG